MSVITTELCQILWKIVTFEHLSIFAANFDLKNDREDKNLGGIFPHTYLYFVSDWCSINAWYYHQTVQILLKNIHLLAFWSICRPFWHLKWPWNFKSTMTSTYILIFVLYLIDAPWMSATNTSHWYILFTWWILTTCCCLLKNSYLIFSNNYTQPHTNNLILPPSSRTISKIIFL